MEKGKTDELFEPFNWTNNTEQTEKKAVELTREQTKARTNERKLVRMNESSYEQRKLVRTKKARTNERIQQRMDERTNKQWKEQTLEWKNERTSNKWTNERNDGRTYMNNERTIERTNERLEVRTKKRTTELMNGGTI